MGVRHFDGDLTKKPGVLGSIHGGHSALTHQFQHPVPAQIDTAETLRHLAYLLSLVRTPPSLII